MDKPWYTPRGEGGTPIWFKQPDCEDMDSENPHPVTIKEVQRNPSHPSSIF